MSRATIFISKATPGDDEFVLWLAPRLEAAGYKVFADILNLQGGDRWRKEVTDTLQNRAIKMLLCCRNSTLEKNGVQEEISIAEDLAKELKDPRFIIPLRIEPFNKIFGIGGLHYVDFVGGWASGLKDLLDSLERQGVPCSTSTITINPNWENYKKRSEIKIIDAPELLMSNWLRVSHVPEMIRYYQPILGIPIDHELMACTCMNSPFLAEVYLRGFFSFAMEEEIEPAFAGVGKFVVHSEHNLENLLEHGSTSPNIRTREAQNLIFTIFRKSWERFCRTKGLYEYPFVQQLGFHITKDQIPLGTKIIWSRHGQRRSSMLRNAAGGKVWQYGVSATPYFWPFLHFKIKARVLFADIVSKEAGSVITDTGEQHRLRRSICKGWRNKAWHGRLMAFLAHISDESPSIRLPLSNSSSLMIDTNPISVTLPVTTDLPDTMSDDAEEQDFSTLGNFNAEDDD
ncbi:MAG: hypothetical protein CVU43_20395 [Chloroflexi bacterium HGW-Chloroflexi-5]|jgi:hypothetical protein|nr:MAG: hypothetical protein CVU70_00120 [Deltaproteobacteria bacterium HGW-Deltaproteobacteria-5]PKN96498.1 MAG: hypothetical protein CVU43_20395 [Chloroflexi bacterium HGW-Chloroflexi-5]